MAYYHGSVKLNRYERFELAGDKKVLKTKAPKPPKQEYGCGIAAQFGLVKKATPANFRKNEDDTRLKKKKKKRIESEEEDDSDSTFSRSGESGERSEKKTCPSTSSVYASDNARHEKRKESEKHPKLSKGTKKSAPKGVNFGFLGHEEVDNDSDEKSSNRNKNIVKKKGKHSDVGHSKNVRRSISSPNEDSENSDDDGSEREIQSKRMSNGEVAKDKIRKHNEVINPEKKKKKRERSAVDDDLPHCNDKGRDRNTASTSSKVGHSKKRNKSLSSPIEDSENSDDDSDKQYKRSMSNEDLAKCKMRKQNEVTNPQKKKKKRDRCSVDDDVPHGNDKGKERYAPSTSKKVSHSKDINRSLSSPNESENSDDDTDRDMQYKRSMSNDDVVKNKMRKHKEVANVEKKKKRNDDDLSHCNNKDKDRNKDSESARLNKQKTFTIPKLNKQAPVLDEREKPKQLASMSNNSSKEKLNKNDKDSENDLKMRRVSKESTITTSSEPIGVKSRAREESTSTTCIEAIDIKTEPSEEVTEVARNISQEYTKIRNKSRLKSSSNYSQVINNVDSTSSLSSSPMKSDLTSEQRKSLLIKEKEKRSSNTNLHVDIKIEPDEEEAICSNTGYSTSSNTSGNISCNSSENSKKCSMESFDSPYEKSASSLIEEYVTDEGKGKETSIKVNLDNDICIVRSTKKICSLKGEDLTDWFRVVNDKLGKKSTKTDNSSLNFFITLHSRFKVMTETMEMSDLEVLPEEEGKEGQHEPIRIFTSLCKDHYQQYLEESYLNSIPELIITRLYSVTP